MCNLEALSADNPMMIGYTIFVFIGYFENFADFVSFDCYLFKERRSTMPESTNNTPSPANNNLITDLALLDDLQFRKGFTDGIDAYLSEVEMHERPVTTDEVCEVICHEFDPTVRQNDLAHCAFYGWPPPSRTYSIGFMAGWIAAHTSELSAPTT